MPMFRRWLPAEHPKAIRSKSCSFLRLSVSFSDVLYNGTAISFRLSLQNQQQNHAHRQVGQNQQDKEAVAAVKASQLLENALAMRSHRQTIQVAGDVLAQFLYRGIA